MASLQLWGERIGAANKTAGIHPSDFPRTRAECDVTLALGVVM